MRVDPKHLVRRLTPTCTRALENAVVRAHSDHYYEVTVEHVLLALLEAPRSDAEPILRWFERDARNLVPLLHRALESFQQGNTARPVFSDTVFRWFEDSWLWASVEQNASRLRSGALLAQYASHPTRYSGESLPGLADLPANELKARFQEILSSAPETAEADEPRLAGDGDLGVSPERTALDSFTISLTARANHGELDPVFGRHREIRQLIDVLARRRKNNPIIVGEPGVGKTALVEGLALAIRDGEVPDSLRKVEVRALDMGLLQAGASVRGEFENRLKAVIEQTRASPHPIILFIDEAHTLIGAGGAPGGSDAANLLKPALARGELRTIAATTWSEFKRYFEKDAALERRFQPIRVDEPSEADAITMLRGLSPSYEKAHGVRILDEAVTAAVSLSLRYVSGRQLPDKAIDLLDTAAARLRVLREGRPEQLVEREHELFAVQREKAAIERDSAENSHARLAELQQRISVLLHEIEELRARWLEQKEAQAGEGAVANLPPAADCSSVGAPLLVPKVVDASTVAAVVASWTGIPVGKLCADRIASALDLEPTLARRIKGQPGAIASVGEAIRMAFSGIRNPEAPIAVLLFAGPSGVGKTETALALADALYGGERALVTINMSEFQEKHTVSRLIGSPPGYVGYGQGGILTEAVRQRPFSLLLLDECEKADPEVLNLFYQVFDKGQLSDGEGRLVDFRNTVIILTSNLGSEQILRHCSAHPGAQAEELASLIRPSLVRHFKAALLARMTVVPFVPVGEQAMRDIMETKLAALGSRLRQAHGIEVNFEKPLAEELARRCTAEDAGARNVEHVLKAGLMPAISRAILERLAQGSVPSHLTVGLGATDDWRLLFSSSPQR